MYTKMFTTSAPLGSRLWEYFFALHDTLQIHNLAEKLKRYDQVEGMIKLKVWSEVVEVVEL